MITLNVIATIKMVRNMISKYSIEPSPLSGATPKYRSMKSNTGSTLEW